MKIKDLRIAAGLTQQQLAEKSKISRENISRYESGMRIPSIRSLKAIASALGASVKDLVDDE